MPPAPNVSQLSDHLEWIGGRIETLLSHYFQPDQPQEVTEAALDDWVEVLVDYSQDHIENACKTYMRNQPRKRPTPGDIRSICEQQRDRERMRSQRANAGRGNRNDLSGEELRVLDMEILPGARRWVNEIPGLAEQGARLLAHWGQPISVEDAIRLRRDHGITLSPEDVADPDDYRSHLDQLRKSLDAE